MPTRRVNSFVIEQLILVAAGVLPQSSSWRRLLLNALYFCDREARMSGRYQEAALAFILEDVVNGFRKILAPLAHETERDFVAAAGRNQCVGLGWFAAHRLKEDQLRLRV